MILASISLEIDCYFTSQMFKWYSQLSRGRWHYDFIQLSMKIIQNLINLRIQKFNNYLTEFNKKNLIWGRIFFSNSYDRPTSFTLFYSWHSFVLSWYSDEHFCLLFSVSGTVFQTKTFIDKSVVNQPAKFKFPSDSGVLGMTNTNNEILTLHYYSLEKEKCSVLHATSQSERSSVTCNRHW